MHLDGADNDASNIEKQSRDVAEDSPIQSLPAELLARTLARHFNTTRSSRKSYSSNPEIDIRLAPLAVCRRWRETALSNPECWSKVAISEVFSSSDRFAGTLRMKRKFEFHLSRAGDLPVELFVYTEVVTDHPNHPKLELRDTLPASEALGRYASKLEKYSESGYAGYFHAGCATISRFDLLTHLRLKTMVSSIPRSSWDLPALEALFIDCLPDYSKLLDFNCPRLNSFTLGNSTVSTAGANPDSSIGGRPLETFLHKHQALQKVELPWNIEFRFCERRNLEVLIIHSSSHPGNTGHFGSVPLLVASFPQATTVIFNSLRWFPVRLPGGTYSTIGPNAASLKGSLKGIKNLEIHGYWYGGSLSAFILFENVTRIQYGPYQTMDCFSWGATMFQYLDDESNELFNLMKQPVISDGPPTFKFTHWLHLRELVIVQKAFLQVPGPGDELRKTEETQKSNVRFGPEEQLELAALLSALKDRYDASKHHPTSSHEIRLTLRNCFLRDRKGDYRVPVQSYSEVSIPDCCKLSWVEVEQLFRNCSEKLAAKSGQVGDGTQSGIVRTGTEKPLQQSIDSASGSAESSEVEDSDEESESGGSEGSYSEEGDDDDG